jgi:hypothetical protein
MGAMSRAMQGEKPGGIAGRQVTLTATTERAVRQSRKLANTCRLLNVLSIESEGYLSGGDLK